jgi:lysozyme
MNPSQNCINLIKQFEGYRTKAYLDAVGVPTIGYGSTMWNDGKKVQLGETITLEGAGLLLYWEVNRKAVILDSLILTQNQYDALTSFIYNVGSGAFSKSTLLKKVKANPNDSAIRNEFLKWNKGRVNGVLVELKGLTRRRNAEADMYFCV